MSKGEKREEHVKPVLDKWLIGESPIAGILLENGDVITVHEAKKRGCIRQGTEKMILEAQAATGAILDPKKGTRCNIAEAKKQGLVDKNIVTMLNRSMKAVLGDRDRASTSNINGIESPLMSMFQAMAKGKVMENHGMRCLEAQLATGGLVDPKVGHRVPLETAKKRGLIDERIYSMIENRSEELKSLHNPNTNELQTYTQLLSECVLDPETGLQLFPYRRSKSADPVKQIVCDVGGKPVSLQEGF